MVNISDKISQLTASVDKLKALDIDASDTIEQIELAVGSVGVIIGSWAVYKWDIGSSFVLGHYNNGRLGSVTAPQPVLGSLTGGTKTLIVSGGSGT